MKETKKPNQQDDSLILPASTPRNPLVVPSRTRSGAGKHSSTQKVKTKGKPWEQIEMIYPED